MKQNLKPGTTERNLKRSNKANMFSEIVTNKYFLLATHFITNLPKKLPFSAKIKFYILLIKMSENFFLLIFLFVGHMRMGKTCQHS
jgi:hypothetical protein